MLASFFLTIYNIYYVVILADNSINFQLYIFIVRAKRTRTTSLNFLSAVRGGSEKYTKHKLKRIICPEGNKYSIHKVHLLK